MRIRFAGNVEIFLPWTNWLANVINFGVALMARTNFGRYANSIRAPFAADWLAFSWWRKWKAFVAGALLGSGAVSVKTAIRTFRYAKLSVRLKRVAVSAGACVVLIAVSVATSDGTGWETEATQISHVIREANAVVRRLAEAIDATVLTDGVTFSEIVNISLIPFTTNLQNTKLE